MHKVIIDTNILLVPALFKIDIFSEIKRVVNFGYELCIFDRTIDELKNIIEKQKGKHKEAAKLALQLINKKIQEKTINIINTHEKTTVDKLVIDLSKQEEIVVVTQDRALIKEIKPKAKIIMLRQKKYLTFV